jgi:hypothetical protein
MKQQFHGTLVPGRWLQQHLRPTGGGKWIEITIFGDPLYQHLLLTAEKKFWRCVQSGEPPRLFGIEPPRARLLAASTTQVRLLATAVGGGTVISTTSSQTLEFKSAVGTSGTAPSFQIDAGAILKFDAAVGTSSINPTVTFNSSTGVLDLSSLSTGYIYPQFARGP